MENKAPLSPRIRFRQLRPTDLDLLCQLNSDEGVMEYIDHHPPTRETVDTEMQRIIQKYHNEPRFGRWIAETTAVNGAEFIGWFSLDVQGDSKAQSDETDEAEDNDQRRVLLRAGYRLRRQFWGRGLATEGTRALISYAFKWPDVTKIEAETMFVNSRSRRVIEKCGMKYVRTFHLHFDEPLPGTELGEVLYAISREEWPSSSIADEKEALSRPRET